VNDGVVGTWAFGRFIEQERRAAVQERMESFIALERMTGLIYNWALRRRIARALAANPVPTSPVSSGPPSRGRPSGGAAVSAHRTVRFREKPARPTAQLGPRASPGDAAVYVEDHSRPLVFGSDACRCWACGRGLGRGRQTLGSTRRVQPPCR
jgi:hypothetical protein